MFRRKHEGLSFYQKEEKINASTVRWLLSLVIEALIAAFLAFVLVYSLGLKTTVIGVSMEPTLYHSQEVFVDRFSYMLFSPKRGDVIAFWPNGNKNSHIYVKRVVGLPGETVEIRGGKVYINGEVFPDDYDKIAEAGIAEGGLTLGTGEYFVLGDNRNNSEDSRYANIGPVASDTVLGRAWFKMAKGESGIGIIR